MQCGSAGATSVSQWLHHSASLLGLYQKKAMQLIEWNRLWQQHGDPNLALCSRIANFREPCLIIEVDNAAWASRIRYWVPDLLNQLRAWSGLGKLQEIKCYVKFPDPKPVTEKRKVNKITPHSAILLHSIADTITHAGLRAALKQLAS